MIEDARLLPIESNLDADVIIAGAGAAGLSLGLGLMNSGLSVLLLESGGLSYERDTQSLYRGRNIGLRYEPLDLVRVRTFGGSTDKRGWAGWCKPFANIDFEKRDWVNLSGWPIPRSELDESYEHAFATTGLPADGERKAAARADSARQLPLSGDCVNDPIMLSSAPQLGGAWLETFRRATNVRVLLHANITTIVTSPDDRSVTRVVFSTLERRQFTAKARAVVLAAGGVENARLMLANKRACGTGAGWVGRCFMDHPRFAWGQISALDDPRRIRDYDPTDGVGMKKGRLPQPGQDPILGFGISISEAAQRKHRILGSRSWILPVAPSGETSGSRELREIALWLGLRRRIPSDLATRAALVAKDLPNAAAAAFAHIASMRGKTTHWQFVTTLEPEPNRDSRVLLDQSNKDPLGIPRVALDWRLTPQTAHSLAITQELIVNQLRTEGVSCAIIGNGGEAANQTVANPRWVWHLMGTTRMSDDATTGVVDGNCKVHGMDNLYLAGSSVFPTCSTDMPTLTVIALAYRLSARLKQVLQAEPAPSRVFEPLPSPLGNPLSSQASSCSSPA